jgi:hypothetical protein
MDKEVHVKAPRDLESFASFGWRFGKDARYLLAGWHGHLFRLVPGARFLSEPAGARLSTTRTSRLAVIALTLLRHSHDGPHFQAERSKCLHVVRREFLHFANDETHTKESSA